VGNAARSESGLPVRAVYGVDALDGFYPEADEGDGGSTVAAFLAERKFI
jgi:hypothetical protein